MIRRIIYNYYGYKLKMKYRNRLVVSGRQTFRRDTRCLIEGNGKIVLGKNVNVHDRFNLTAINGELCIDDNTSFNRNCLIICRNSIKIGKNCMFGPNVMIYDHDHLFDVDKIYENKFTSGQIVIEEGCWIGAGVIILKNTHVGKGSIIGAGTVLKGDIPAHSIVLQNRENRVIPIKNK